MKQGYYTDSCLRQESCIAILLFHVIYNELMNNDIFTYSENELKELIVSLGFPKFRGSQLFQWLHQNHVFDFNMMHTLPKQLRETLLIQFPSQPVEVIDRQISNDGTRKYILKLADGLLVETVGIPSYSNNNDCSSKIERLTVCVSTQVGCPMECSFCATGKEGFTRNLSSSEIIQEVCVVESDFNSRVSNVVFMGQGEPFLNYEAVVASLKELNQENGFNIGARHITVSTCGILNGIKLFSELPQQYVLAISLHSAIQSKRDDLLPKCSSQTLSDLKDSLLNYQISSGRRITFEYLLIKDINDSEEDLLALINYCHGLKCHINLIPYNSTGISCYQPSDPSLINIWIETLTANGIDSSIRHSKGSDIAGACGQLKNNFLTV